jgi:hypothetical protein
MSSSLPGWAGVLPRSARHNDGQAVDIDYQLLDMLLVFWILVAAATRRLSMSTIDKQCIAAIRKLEQLGYMFAGDDWIHPANDATAIAPTITSMNSTPCW